MYTDGLLFVRPLQALYSNPAMWKHFACKGCSVGHAPLAVHYFDREHVREAPALDLPKERKAAYLLEAAENEGECLLLARIMFPLIR